PRHHRSRPHWLSSAAPWGPIVGYFWARDETVPAPGPDRHGRRIVRARGEGPQAVSGSDRLREDLVRERWNSPALTRRIALRSRGPGGALRGAELSGRQRALSGDGDRARLQRNRCGRRRVGANPARVGVRGIRPRQLQWAWAGRSVH